MGKKFKWTIEIEVEEFQVKYGFNMQCEYLKFIEEELIPCASLNSVRARIISAPDKEEIRKIQGRSN